MVVNTLTMDVPLSIRTEHSPTKSHPMTLPSPMTLWKMRSGRRFYITVISGLHGFKLSDPVVYRIVVVTTSIQWLLTFAFVACSSWSYFFDRRIARGVWSVSFPTWYLLDWPWGLSGFDFNQGLLNESYYWNWLIYVAFHTSPSFLSLSTCMTPFYYSFPGLNS